MWTLNLSLISEIPIYISGWILSWNIKVRLPPICNLQCGVCILHDLNIIHGIRKVRLILISFNIALFLLTSFNKNWEVFIKGPGQRQSSEECTHNLHINDVVCWSPADLSSLSVFYCIILLVPVYMILWYFNPI